MEFTIDTITHTDLLDMEDRARAADDDDLAGYVCRAMDQLARYELGEWCDVDMVEECCRLLNAEQAITDAAFSRIEASLPVQVQP